MTAVLMWTPESDVVPGGHQVQLECTAQALRSHGIEVTLTHEPDVSLDGYSVVHGVGLSPGQIRRSRAAGVPVCLSTIYNSQRYTLGLDQRMGSEFQWRRRARLALALAGAAIRLRHVEKSERLLAGQLEKRMAYESADLLLPNSELEAEAIRTELGVTTPFCVVPNGIDEAVFSQAAPSEEQRKIDVLYVGRFEPHKNQLGLIRALKDRRYHIVLIGPRHPHHHAYSEQCHREAGPNVEFVEETSHADLVAYYRKARVHAVPSWYETTGLVSLEAATQGCNVVTTNRGFAREYFGSYAWYCDPADPGSITQSVDKALHAAYDPALRDRVLERFTWRVAAEATLAGYRQVLKRRNTGEIVL